MEAPSLPPLLPAHISHLKLHYYQHGKQGERERERERINRGQLDESRTQIELERMLPVGYRICTCNWKGIVTGKKQVDEGAPGAASAVFWKSHDR